MELNSRVASDGSYFSMMTNLMSNMSNYLTLVQSNIDTLTKLSTGIGLFSVEVGNHDGYSLEAVLNTFKSYYDFNQKQVRHQAFTHLQEAVDNFHDIDIIFQYSTSDAWSDLDRAKWFYMSLSQALSQCLLNMEVTVFSLEAVTQAENNYSNFGSQAGLGPTKFYTANTEVTCITTYYTVIDFFNGLGKDYITFAAQRVDAWLHAYNDNKIVCDSYYTQANASTQFNESTTCDNPVLDLWELLSCTQCGHKAALLTPDEWKTIFGNISDGASTTVKNCLLQYETTLTSAIADLNPNVAPPPSFATPSSLTTAMSDLMQYNMKMTNVAMSYMDTSTAQNLSSFASVLITNMSVSLTLCDSSLSSAVQDWQKSVIAWQTGINGVYNTAVDNLGKVAQFLPVNTQLADVISHMAIWLKPTISIEPSVSISYKVKNVNSTVNRIKQDVKSLLLNSARNTISSVLSTVVSDITKRVTTLGEASTVARSQWEIAAGYFTDKITTYLSSLALDDNFVT
jgi:hypothetical protein